MAKKKAAAGVPAWVVTFGDMMSLLLCFFVMLVASSTMDKVKFIEAITSIKEALGYENSLGRVPTTDPSQNSLQRLLETIVIPKRIKNIGDTDDEGLEGKEYRVEQIREGLRITGGILEFDRGTAEPRGKTIEVLKQLADQVRGHTTKIEVRGHASFQPLQESSKFTDRMDLSYFRAKMIADLLVKYGVRSQRIRLVACGSTEPVRIQAYREKEHARNRRVEILVTEVLVSELVGSQPTEGQEP